MKNHLGMAALAAAVVLGVTVSANAGVYIKLQEGSTTAEASTGNSEKSINVTFGDYKVTGSGSQEDDLLLGDFRVISRTAGTHQLTISISTTGALWPSAAANFRSDFLIAAFSGVWSNITIDTYLDPSNHPYGTTGSGVVHLGSVDLVSGSGLFDEDLLNVTPDSVPYSLTAVYHLTSKGASGTNGSLEVFAQVNDPPALPEPGSLALLGTALAGFSIAMRRRREAIQLFPG